MWLVAAHRITRLAVDRTLPITGQAIMFASMAIHMTLNVGGVERALDSALIGTNTTVPVKFAVDGALCFGASLIGIGLRARQPGIRIAIHTILAATTSLVAAVLFTTANPTLPPLDDYALEKIAVTIPRYSEAYAAAAVYPAIAGMYISAALWPMVRTKFRRPRGLIAFWFGAVVLTVYAILRCGYPLAVPYMSADHPGVFELTRILALVGVGAMFAGVAYGTAYDALHARSQWRRFRALHAELLDKWPGVARTSSRFVATSEWVADRASEVLDAAFLDARERGAGRGSARSALIAASWLRDPGRPEAAGFGVQSLAPPDGVDASAWVAQIGKRWSQTK